MKDGDRRIPVAISSCLLGERVRYDGDHKRDRFIAGALAERFEFVPICPEVAIGMGVPRTPVRLIESGTSVKAISVGENARDYTGRLRLYGKERAADAASLCGYLFKAKSPSCGLRDASVQLSNGDAQKTSGLYAREIVAAAPDLPVEDEAGLSDVGAAHSFLERVHVRHGWQSLERPVSLEALGAFHQRHALSALSRSAGLHLELERILAQAKRATADDLADEYFACLMRGLAPPPDIEGCLRAFRSASRFTATSWPNPYPSSLLREWATCHGKNILRNRSTVEGYVAILADIRED